VFASVPHAGHSGSRVFTCAPGPCLRSVRFGQVRFRYGSLLGSQPASMS